MADPTTAPTEVAGLPAGGPATRDAVKVHLGITDTVDDTRLDSIVAAVNGRVRFWRTAYRAIGAETWPADVTEGADMLAARLFRRKNSPAGVESFSELGAVYVMRNDPDIGMLLGLGAWQPPAVG